MMEANKQYDWGCIEVRFAIVALLDLNPCPDCSSTGSRLSERSTTGEVLCAKCGGDGAVRP